MRGWKIEKVGKILVKGVGREEKVQNCLLEIGRVVRQGKHLGRVKSFKELEWDGQAHKACDFPITF